MTINSTAIIPGSEFDTIKAKHKATWEDGDYAEFASYMHGGAVEILQGWNLGMTGTLLDIGCGSGQTAIPAAKAGLTVTGVDIAENLIDHARQTARDAGLDEAGR